MFTYDRLHLAEDAGTDGGTLLTSQQAEGSQGVQNNDQGQANNQKEGSVPGWLSGVSAEYRDNLKGYPKTTDFVKEALTWKEKSEKAIVKPQEGATAEEVEAYRKAMGIPSSYDKYELPENPLVTKEYAEDLKKFYHEQGLSTDQAKALHEKFIGQVNDGVKALQKANLEARQTAEATLKKEAGADYPNLIRDAQAALRRFATADDVHYLTKTGLGNDAGIIKMFANIQRQIGGDSLLSTSTAVSVDNELRQRFPNSPSMWGSK